LKDSSERFGTFFKLILIFSSFFLYAFLFYFLYEVMGRSAGTLGIIPIFVSAWFFKVPGGIISGAAAFILQTVILGVQEHPEPLFSGSRVFIGGIDLASGLLLGILRVVLERYRKTFSQLQTSQANLKDAQVIARFGHWEIVPGSGVFTMSDPAYDVLGIKEERGRYTMDKFISMILPEDREEVQCKLQEAVTGLEGFSVEYRIQSNSGAVRYFRSIGRFNSDEKKWIGTVQDITPEKEVQNELKAAKLGAERANQAKNNFLANMSHEIRTPISGIIGVSEMLIEKTGDGETKENLEMIHQTANHLLGIINEILDLSVLEEGKVNLAKENVDLDEIVTRLTNILKTECLAKGLTFKVKNDAPGLRFHGDPRRLSQILINILGNAVKFSSHGTVFFSVSAAAEDTDRVTLQFVVRDEGPGIPPEQYNLIFQRFYQVDNRFSKSVSGSGLGLSIVKHLTELMDGTIQVVSTEGKGSEFTIRIPFSKVPEDSAEKEEIRSSVSVPPLRVLLAEDSRINQKYILNFLEGAGHSVSLAVNGIEALALLKERVYDLVLMDVQMPEMDGMEAARKIRAGEAGDRNVSIPIAALTAYAMSNDREKFLQAGMNEVIIKPVKKDMLNAHISELIKK
jgi:signal transduction histidine kinase/CheY-like chemotaxis protein